MNILEFFKPVTTFVFDVDGVLTDGTLIVLPNGVLARRMNIKDGYALQLAIKKGYRVVIISGSNSDEVRGRLNKLGITDVFMRIENKSACLLEYFQDNQLQASETLFMGDDIPDYEVMQDVGISCCPADAVPEIKNISKYISSFKGGEGCARDVIEKVMKLRGDWMIDTGVKAQ